MKTDIDQILKDIGKEAVRLDWKVAFGGKAYGNNHLFRVNKIAKKLSQLEGGDPFVIEVAAWIHDVPLVNGNDETSVDNTKFMMGFLNNFPGISLADKKNIVKAAISHENPEANISLEAKIVHDADVVDKGGWLGIIRHIFKMTNMIKMRKLKGKRDWTDLIERLNQRNDMVFTSTARKWLTELNKGRQQLSEKDGVRLMEKISEMAFSGVISDRIGLWLIEQNVDFSEDLKKQLECSYL